ncbi:NAD(+) synthase (plasmid) [Aneurinibacillus sp. Ricciae_BoGa-3]|uniref:NAD(+) synthase n=1 Tax=Aneurinibacillus sp. Ricciae_BoGa-3 TaxID=3022697 RepID=UPI00233F8A41|nr:NAD(+) synthase [Aneurinibacillus sp. Ricciae_BoGa-3]WCK57773.1 NAD(+) synthase [Aneurinibacillus sp. Ricciae_BoGa-3]
MDLFEHGYIRAGVAVPTLEVANPTENSKRIYDIIKRAEQEKVKVLVFPELSIPGYTSADLFHQRLLLDESEQALGRLLEETQNMDMMIAVGMPIEADNQLFNTAVVFHKGKIFGVVPKTFIPNYNEFYERRWFASSNNRISNMIELCEQVVPFNENLFFEERKTKAVIGVEICEDLWMPIPPSSYHAVNGANIIANLSASNEIVGKADYRRDLVRIQSAKTLSAYLYVSAGQTESTTDVVFSGHSMIAENGSILKEIRFIEESTFIYQDIDIERLRNDRRKFNTFMGKTEKRDYQTVRFSFDYTHVVKQERYTNAYPFVPSKKEERDERCKEIFQIQSTGLMQRLAKTGIQKAVIGISGGLDSTLALLVMVEAFKRLKLPLTNIVGITMPGFGTTDRTYQNAVTLMKELGITWREIPIRSAVNQHFEDIGQDKDLHDLVYENSQARERTQILMDVANQVNGLVVGTGDLSELALGWCTYNADHMSMYAVNASVPKTLVRYVVEWVADTSTSESIAVALKDISDTPVSPELLPPDKDGKIVQKTEQTVGSYELHDFFLYHMLRFGYRPSKIYFLTREAFGNKHDEIEVWTVLKTFYQRFFTQQFKRSCLPDGVKVGSICLSPRGDWRMPSDASYEIWKKELESI